jgi:hypothetical protein
MKIKRIKKKYKSKQKKQKGGHSNNKNNNKIFKNYHGIPCKKKGEIIYVPIEKKKPGIGSTPAKDFLICKKSFGIPFTRIKFKTSLSSKNKKTKQKFSKLSNNSKCSTKPCYHRLSSLNKKYYQTKLFNIKTENRNRFEDGAFSDNENN